MPITKATASSIAPAAKGDLVVGSATNDAAVLGVGSNDQVLTADSSTATGLKWATAASGGGLTLLSTTSLTGSSVTVSSISGSYKNLYIIVRGVYASSSDDTFIRFNSDTGSNYSYNLMQVVNSSVSGDNQEDVTSININGAGTFSTANRLGYAEILVQRYTESEPKFILTRAKHAAGATPNKVSRMAFAIWNNNNAITSFTVFQGTGTFSAGTIYIYGES